MGKGEKDGKSRRFVTEVVKMRKWSAVRDSLLLMTLFLFYHARIRLFRFPSIYACFDPDIYNLLQLPVLLSGLHCYTFALSKQHTQSR